MSDTLKSLPIGSYLDVVNVTCSTGGMWMNQYDWRGRTMFDTCRKYLK